MFEVRWEESVLLELANLRPEGDGAAQQALDAAVQNIIQRLHAAAATEGESRAGRQRILFEPPLIITFQVEADGRTASVLTVRRLRHRGQ